MSDENTGAAVEMDPDDLSPQAIHERLMKAYLETDDPIIWRLLEG